MCFKEWWKWNFVRTYVCMYCTYVCMYCTYVCCLMTWVIPLNLPGYTVSDIKFEPRTKWTQTVVIKRNDAKLLHCAGTRDPHDQELWADSIWRTALAVEGCLWATLRSQCPWPSGTVSVPRSSAGRSLQHLHAATSFRRCFLIKIILVCLYYVLFKINFRQKLHTTVLEGSPAALL
jgi:hypothetical protein